MPSIYELKPAFSRLCRSIAGDWMTPNMATALGMLCAAGIGAGFWLGFRVSGWFLLLPPPLLVLRMAFNALDGLLAREKGLADRRGEALNELCDIGGDCISYLPVAFAAPAELDRSLTFAIVIVTLLTEFTGLLGKAVVGTRLYEGPLGGKSDRAFWFGLGSLILVIWPGAVVHAARYLTLVLIFVLATWLNRLRSLWRKL